MAKVTIEVKGMHCKSCEMIIKESLEEMDGVKNVKAIASDDKVSLDLDEKKTSLKKVKEVIKKGGYDPK